MIFILSFITCLDAPLVTTRSISSRVFLGDPVARVVNPALWLIKLKRPCCGKVARSSLHNEHPLDA